MTSKAISTIIYTVVLLAGGTFAFALPTITRTAATDAHPMLFSKGEQVRGFVVDVMDGDTLKILTQERQELRIRLAEIDAPEKSQSFGEQSSRSLSDLTYNKPADVIVLDTDRSGRIVGRVYIGSLDISMAQVGRGLAWADTKSLTDDRISKLEHVVREKQIGLWSAKEQPTPPWEFVATARTK